MKAILVVLLLVSSSVFAQGYGDYPQQQYQQIDRYQQMEQQRQLQQEFLDQQYANQQDLMNQQTLRMEVDRMEQGRKRDRSTFPGWQ
jgi:Tfp pilus assembly protein PilO